MNTHRFKAIRDKANKIDTGARHTILIPKNAEVKEKCKKAGARWDGELMTWYYCSDDEKHELQQYTLENYAEIILPSDFGFDQRKEMDDAIEQECNGHLTKTTINGVWHTFIHVNDDTADVIGDLMEEGMIK